MSGVYKGSGDTNFRRTWNKDEYAKKGVERSAGINTQINVDLQQDTQIEFSQLINTTKTVISVDESGFSCAVCSLNFKDNLTYLDHLNSREHMAAMGTAVTVPRSTIKQVRDRLALGKKVKEKKVDPKERMMNNIKAQELEKLQKKLDKKQKKAGADVEVDDMVLAGMGFGGFGSTKK
jgi:U4/U6.U5 tri-snRNP component SNU23